MGKLEGRVIVVTGASRGIGLAIAQRLGREGARLVLVARSPKGLRQAVKQVEGESVAIRADVSKPSDVRRLFDAVHRRFGLVDVLVNNAGAFTYKPFRRTTLADWRRNIETNLTSLFLTTRAALPLLGRSRAAHLVNIISISGRLAFPKCSAYTAAKFGALGLTRVLAEELRPKKIRVTAIVPGSTDTRMVEEFDFPVDRAALMQPEDIAEAVLSVLLQPARTNVDEIVLTPSRGKL